LTLRPSFAAFDRLRANDLHGPPPFDLSERLSRSG
jgi:hypothetical protein